MNDVGDLGRRVATRRRALGLSEAEVAERAGMDPHFVASLEHRASPQLSRSALWRLAGALDTTVDTLVGGGMEVPPGRNHEVGRPALAPMGRAECLHLLRPGGIGRVVFVEARGPVALPVNFSILNDDVVFRSHPSPALAAALQRGPVSFEVDHLDEALAEGWSVLVTGEGRVVTDPEELLAADRSRVMPWAGGVRRQLVRLMAGSVTGRRILHR